MKWCWLIGHKWYKGRASWVCTRNHCRTIIAAPTNGTRVESSEAGSYRPAADAFYVDVTKRPPHQTRSADET